VISPVVTKPRASWDRLDKHWGTWLKGQMWELQEPWKKPLTAQRMAGLRGENLLSTSPFSPSLWGFNCCRNETQGSSGCYSGIVGEKMSWTMRARTGQQAAFGTREQFAERAAWGGSFRHPFLSSSFNPFLATCSVNYNTHLQYSSPQRWRQSMFLDISLPEPCDLD
jgi:hypothetical protein